MIKNRYWKNDIEDAVITKDNGNPTNNEKKAWKYTFPRSSAEISQRWQNVMKNATAAELIVKPVVWWGIGYYTYWTVGFACGAFAWTIVDIVSFLETPKKTPNA